MKIVISIVSIYYDFDCVTNFVTNFVTNSALESRVVTEVLIANVTMLTCVVCWGRYGVTVGVPRSKIQDIWYGAVWGVGCGVWGGGCRVWSVGCGVYGVGCGV